MLNKKLLLIMLVAVAVLFLSISGQTTSPSSHDKTVPPLTPCLISISVANLDETIKWYHDNLGFAIKKKSELPRYSLRIAFVEANGFTLELIEFKNSVSYEAIQKQFPNVDDRAKIQGPGKLAFSVADLEALATRLKSKKVHFFRDITHDEDSAQRWFIVSDNNGNWIQFFEKDK